MVDTRLILPEVICLFQGLSHACAQHISPRRTLPTRYCPEEESVDGSLLRLFCPNEVTLMVPIGSKKHRVYRGICTVTRR